MTQLPDDPSPRVSIAPLLLLAAVALLALWPLTTFEFVRWDDPHNLPENPDMTPPRVQSVARYWDPRQPYKDLYIPFTYTVWAGLACLAYMPGVDGPPLNAQVFHAANVLLHLLSSSVVFVILLRLVRRTWAAWAGAAIFAVHPVQVEPVAWVSGMKDVLSGLLSLVAIWLYVEHALRRSTETRQSRAAWPLFAGATTAFALAMLSKPSAVVVPLFVAAIDLLLLRRPARRVAPLVLPWLIMAAIVAIIARRAQPAAGLDFVPPLWGRPIVALDAVAFYLRQIVFPMALAIDYGRSPQWLWNSRQVYFTWLLPVVLAVFLFMLRDKGRTVAVAALILVLGVLPVLGLVPFDFQAYSTVADHYLYLAMLGPALLIAWIVAQSRGRYVIPFATLMIVGFGVRSFAQTWSWQNSRALFAHTLTVNRFSLVGNVNHANLLSDEAIGAMRRQDYSEAAAKFTTAVHYYQLALRLRPHDAQAMIGLANVYVLLGKPADAVGLYTKAMEVQGRSGDLHAKLGRAYMMLPDPTRALEHLNEALRLEPGHPTATVDLQTTLKRRSQP